MTEFSDIKIREITSKDFPQWIKLRKELWPEASYDELKNVEHLFRAQTFACFFAEFGCDLVGFMEIAIRPYVNGCDTTPVAFVEGIWVDGHSQKRGIGRLFIKTAEDWARKHAVIELASDTRSESTHSIHAHKSWGFEETERVVYFRKKLTQSVEDPVPILIRETNESDAPLIKALMDKFWGGEPLLVRDKNFFPSSLPGFLAFQGEKVSGFLFYTIEGDESEIIVFEAFDKFQGLGTKLLEQYKEKIRTLGIKRTYLMTHNDNLDALRFYQKRGFNICQIHLNSMDAARQKKPSIPVIGDYGIPICHEIDLEMFL